MSVTAVATLAGNDMVVTSTHALGRKNVVQVVARAAGPFLDDLKHVSMELVVMVTEGRVVEHSDYVVKYLLNWHINMVPCVDDARRNILQNSRCYLTGRLIEDVGEMVFGQERMSWIRAAGVSPNLILVTATGVDHGR
jgi:hypothetical protein